jgi:hypothetical protein
MIMTRETCPQFMSRGPGMSLSALRRAGLLAAAAALPLSLLTAVPASAGAVAPFFSYVDVSAKFSATLSTADADGSNPTALLPAGYQVMDYDVTQDGQTELLAVQGCSGADCANERSLTSTQALLLVHHDAVYGTRARIIATWWEGQPRLTADGSPVWLDEAGTVWRITGIDYTTPDWADPSLSPTLGTVASSSAFSELSIVTTGAESWYTQALAVSADGSRVAVLQSDFTTPVPKSRVLAGDFATGAAAGATYYSHTWPSTGDTVPEYGLFTFLEDNGARLAFRTEKPAEAPIISTTSGEQERYESAYVATLSTDSTTPAVRASALDNVYSLRKLGSTWWGWKDSANPGNTAIVSSYGSSDTPDTVAIAPLVPRSNGDVTAGYEPTTAKPPVLAPAMVVHRLSGSASLRMKVRSVAAGKRDTFWPEFTYGQLPSQSPARAVLGAVQKGALLYSTDAGRSWHSTPTPGTTVKVGYQWWSVTPKLYRNTWFRWSYAGDMLTAPASTSSRRPVLVTVSPRFSAFGVAKVGARRVVSGTLSRVGGTAVLYRKVSATRWTALATVRVSSTGAFTFGRRPLARGSYKVVAVADTWWAASTRPFTV